MIPKNHEIDFKFNKIDVIDQTKNCLNSTYCNFSWILFDYNEHQINEDKNYHHNVILGSLWTADFTIRSNIHQMQN